MSRYIGETWSRAASSPDGYGIIGLVPAIKSGAMTAGGAPVTVMTGSANVLAGGPISGDGTISMNGTSELKVQVQMAGDGSIIVTADGASLKMVLGMNGDATLSFQSSGGLNLIIPFSGGGVVGVSGSADLRGFLNMVGAWTPFTDLSPENLAAAVWDAVAASHDNAGTMGEKMNGAGSAGNPWTEVIESGLTAAEIMRLILAIQTGETSIQDLGNGAASVTFKSVDRTKNRVQASMDGSERVSITLDGS